MPKWPKGTVCKTVIRRFESGRHLQSSLSIMAPRRQLAERPVTALGVIAPPPINIQSPAFEGSLAMLFQCVRDQRIDLLGVPLYPVCEAYFEYLLLSESPNLDEAAAALTALAYLLERKAWLLLPSPEPEPESAEPMQLPESSITDYDLAIGALLAWHAERSLMFFRSPGSGPSPYEFPYELESVSSQDLALAFERLLRRADSAIFEPPTRARRSLSEQIGIVLRAIDGTWRTLGELVTGRFSRADAVYWFLALLELIRVGQVSAKLDGDLVLFCRA